MKKLSLGEGGIKGLVTRHVEKVVFGVAVLLVLLFVYSGFRLEGYGKLPTELRERSTMARQHIDKDSWEAIASDPQRITETNYPVAVKEGSAPTRGALYPYEMPLKRPLVRPLVKRSDPTLYAPVKLVVRAMNAPIALKNKSGQVDKLADLENAEPPEPPKPKPKKEDRRPRGGGRAAGGTAGMSAAAMMQMPGMGDGEDGGAGLLGSMPGMPEMPGGAGTGMPGMPGTGGTGAKVRLLMNPEGWRPAGAGMGSMGMSMPGMMMPGMMPGAEGDDEDAAAMPTSSSNSLDKMIAEPAHIVAIMALIPFEKQYDEYRRVFEDAVGYTPQRDRPNYVAFRVERAEVSDDPNAEVTWVYVGGTNGAMNAAKQLWAGVGSEVVNPLYLDEFTSMPIPPILLRDFEELATHPELPKQSQKSAGTMNTMPGPEETAPQDGDVPSDIPTARRGAGMAMGMSMPPTGAGMGMGMPPTGAGMGMGMSMPPTGAGMGMGMPPTGSGMGMAMPGGMTGAGMGMSMPGMMGMGSYGGINVTEWKLVRYYDFTAEPGKKYKYRIQLLVEDPNHPKLAEMDVNTRMLDDTAAARVTEVIAKEKGEHRVYYRYSDWSEASDSISLPPYERYFAGGPAGKAATQSHKNGAEVYTRPPEAKMVGVVWDHDWGLDLTYDKEVMHGSVLNHEGDVEAVHPLTLEFKIFEDYDLRAKACVVDMRGGQAVGGESNEPLLSPSEFAVVDGQGNLVVRTEVEDLDGYRRYAFVDQTGSAGTGGLGGMTMPGMPGGGPPGMSIPGMDMPTLQGPGAPGAGGAGGGRGGRGNRRGNR